MGRLAGCSSSSASGAAAGSQHPVGAGLLVGVALGVPVLVGVIVGDSDYRHIGLDAGRA